MKNIRKFDKDFGTADSSKIRCWFKYTTIRMFKFQFRRTIRITTFLATSIYFVISVKLVANFLEQNITETDYVVVTFINYTNYAVTGQDIAGLQGQHNNPLSQLTLKNNLSMIISTPYIVFLQERTVISLIYIIKIITLEISLRCWFATFMNS